MRRIAAVFAVMGLLGVACASPRARPVRPPGPASAGNPSPEAMQSPRPAQSPASSTEAPEELRFEAPLLSGGTVRGASFAGADLVIWFWAPW